MQLEPRYLENEFAYYYDADDNELYEVKILGVNTWDSSNGFVYDIVWKTYPNSMYTQASEKYLHKTREEFFSTLKILDYEEFDDTAFEESENTEETDEQQL